MPSITLTDEYTEMQRARAVPGAFYDRELRAWVVTEPTPRAAAVALRLFPRLAQEYPELLAARNGLAQDVRPFDFATKYNKPIGAPRLRARLEELG